MYLIIQVIVRILHRLDYHNKIHKDWVLDLEKTLSITYLVCWSTGQIISIVKEVI